MDDIPPPPPTIDTRAGFTAAVLWGLHTAVTAAETRRIVCCDPTFADWPWDDPSLLQALAACLRRPQRRLVLLARSYDEMPRRHPRFNAWRAAWAHAIEAWVVPDEMAAALPTVLASDGAVSVQLIDALHWRGRAALDARRARRWCEELDVVLQRSERGFAVNMLGL